VAAAIALGVSLGLRLPDISGQKGPDLWKGVRELSKDSLPVDITEECLSSIEDVERPQPGDWIAIHGGSSTSALFISELARLAGLKVILLADVAKHGEQLGEREGCILIDSHDSSRAINIVRSITKGNLRFAIDTVGRETAGHLMQMLQGAEDGRRCHLVGLNGVPKEKVPEIVLHSVPIKLFHEVPVIGRALMDWLEAALEAEAIALPRIEVFRGGLDGINAALDRMRNGEISGRRLVVAL
jgi:D-arabinose 1-dehydrogenase-like Zn-dependent alcohol dehydrogenase